MTNGRAQVLNIRGHVSEATDVVATAVEIARLSGNVELLAWALATECQVATTRGDLDTAIRCGEEEWSWRRHKQIRGPPGPSVPHSASPTWKPATPTTVLRRAAEVGWRPGLPLANVGQRSITYEALAQAGWPWVASTRRTSGRDVPRHSMPHGVR